MSQKDEHRRRAARLQRIIDRLFEASQELIEELLQELWEINHPGEKRPRPPGG